METRTFARGMPDLTPRMLWHPARACECRCANFALPAAFSHARAGSIGACAPRGPRASHVPAHGMATRDAHERLGGRYFGSRFRFPIAAAMQTMPRPMRSPTIRALALLVPPLNARSPPADRSEIPKVIPMATPTFVVPTPTLMRAFASIVPAQPRQTRSPFGANVSGRSAPQRAQAGTASRNGSMACSVGRARCGSSLLSAFLIECATFEPLRAPRFRNHRGPRCRPQCLSADGDPECTAQGRAATRAADGPGERMKSVGHGVRMLLEPTECASFVSLGKGNVRRTGRSTTKNVEHASDLWDWGLANQGLRG